MPYNDKFNDHFSNPRNVGALDKDCPDVGTGVVGSPVCGDVMKFQIRVAEDGTITEAKFKTFGCGAAIASSSLATELIRGRTVEQALALKNSEIAKDLDLPPVKIHCSVLAADAIKLAVEDWKKKTGRLPPATQPATPEPKGL